MPRVEPIPVTLFRHHIIITLAIVFLSFCVRRRIGLRLSLVLIPSGTEILVFWVLQRLAWLVAPKDVPLMTRRGDLKLSHGATAKAERTP